MSDCARNDDLSVCVAPRQAPARPVPHRITLTYEVHQVKKGILPGTGQCYESRVGWIEPVPYYDVLLCSVEPTQIDLPVGEASRGSGQITLRLSGASSLIDYLPGRRFTVKLAPEDAP